MPPAAREIRWCFPPLGLIVVGFFLPTLRVCGNAVTPAQTVVSPGFVWSWPIYVSAFALLVVLGRAFVPGQRLGAAAFKICFAAVVFAALGGGFVSFLLLDARQGPWLAGGPLLAFGLAASSLVAAVRRRGHARWLQLLAAQAWAGTPLAVFYALCFIDEPADLLIGGYLYILAVVALLAGAVPAVNRLDRGSKVGEFWG